MRDIIILTSIDKDMINMSGNIIGDRLMIPYRISHVFFKSERMKKVIRANLSLMYFDDELRIYSSYSLQDIIVSKYARLSMCGLKVRNSLKIIDGPELNSPHPHDRTGEIIDKCLLTVNKIYTSMNVEEAAFHDMTMETLLLLVLIILFTALIVGGIFMVIYDVELYPLLFSLAFVIYWSMMVLGFLVVISCLREKRVSGRVYHVFWRVRRQVSTRPRGILSHRLQGSVGRE